MSFHDRSQAGRLLARALASYKDQDPVVLALPRGGVPVAAEIAEALEADLDLVLVRKIGVPSQPELAMGAVADGPEPVTVRNADVIALVRSDDAEFDRVRDRELAELARRRTLYFGARPHPDIAGHTAIVVDDGVATGATVRAALRAVQARKPARLVLAVPVAATGALRDLLAEADEIVCLEDHELFGAVGCFYDDFRQTPDEAVIAILQAHPVRHPGQSGTT